MKILIIGAGGFGRHHTKSLSQYRNELHVVDPSIDSRNAIDGALNNASQSYSSLDLVSKDLEFDFCIIATNANIRVSQLLAVQSRFRVKSYLLEKVIINNLEDYFTLRKLDMSNLFVNYPRRAYPFYQKLKELLYNYDSVEINMDGGDNSLLCNSMHYIDLFEFLTGEKVDEFDSCLYGFRPAKRQGYIDANGVIVAKSSKGQLVLNNNFQKGKNRFSIKSRGETLIEYIERDGVIIDNLGLNWDSDIVIDQSKLTQKLLENNLEDSAKLCHVLPTNKKFIEALLQQEFFRNMKQVPIT